MFSGGSICVGCRLTECDARCPEAPEPKVVAICDKCGEEIHAGERAFRIDGDVFCEDCATPEDLAAFYGWDGWERFES